MMSSCFETIGLSVLQKKCKIDFQEGGHLEFQVRTNVAIFLSTSRPNTSFYLKSICLSVQKKKRTIDFQYGGHDGHLGFPIGTIF